MAWLRGTRRVHDAEFEEFVATSTRSLRRTAYLMCGDWHRAEDIVQSALVRVYLNWSRIERASGPGPYARKAVVNAAIDERRRPWRREQAVAESPEPADVRDHATTSADHDEVVQALASLPARQRAVVVLRYAEDHDVETTAALLGISPGTVKSHASRGLAALRVRLGRASSITDKEAAS